MKKKRKLISSEEFDRIFDEGKEDIMQYVDPTSIRQPGLESKRMNLDLPAWMMGALSREAARLGIARQALVKTWLAERLAK
jgi:hypothetical protein